MQRLVLIIEDSKEDYAAILRALNCDSSEVRIVHSLDGDAALANMRRDTERGELGRLPQLILLDLNLPGTDGREILLELKSDEQLKNIPVVVLTTSTNPRDIADCYGKGANVYCVKGGDGATFVETVQAFKRFWLEAAILPNSTD